MGFIEDDIIVLDFVMVIYNVFIWFFGILEFKMYMVWLEFIGGKLEICLCYLVGLVYNIFLILEFLDSWKNMFEEVVFEMLDV